MQAQTLTFPLKLWYLQEFLRGLVLIYPTYLIMMEQSGIGPLGLSVLLAIWSGSLLLFEVPSGVLGDLLPRRWLLVAVAHTRTAEGQQPRWGTSQLGLMGWWRTFEKKA